MDTSILEKIAEAYLEENKSSLLLSNSQSDFIHHPSGKLEFYAYDITLQPVEYGQPVAEAPRHKIIIPAEDVQRLKQNHK